jgi:3-oxoacyl-[acyl-carrier-protein] synthase III
MGAAITGWGTALPRREVTNEELAESLDVSPDWIFERTGIRTRRLAADEDSAASLATIAARQALEKAEVEPDELDLVVLATSTPVAQMPATASLVQAELGAVNAGAFDLNAACSGFLVALAQGTAQVEAGMVRRVLVCGADLLSRVLDYSDPRSCILFGDGAGAVILEAGPGATRLGPFRIRSDGSKAHLLHIPPDDGHLRMQGREVYRHAVARMTTSVREVLDAGDVTIDDVDLLVAHQANARIVEAVAARVGLEPRKAMLNIHRLGNTSAASIPLALAEAVSSGRLDDGDLVVLAAFGAGFVWGAGLVRWGTGTIAIDELVGAGRARA